MLLRCLLLIVAGSSWQAAGTPPAELLDTDLLASTRAALQSTADAEDTLRSLLAEIEKGTASLGDLTGDVDGEPPAVPTPVLELPDEPAEVFEAEIERHREHLKFLVDRGPRLEDLANIAATVEEQLDRWSEIEKALVTAASDAQPLLAEVARRLDAGTLAIEDVTLPDDLDVVGWQARLASIADPSERTSSVTEARTRLERARQTLESVTPVSEEDLARQTEDRDLAEILLSLKRMQGAEREALQAEDPAAVRAAVDSLLVAFGDALTAYTAVEEQLNAAQASVEALQEEFETIEAPQLDQFDGGEGHPELREVQRRLRLAEALLEYRKQRLDLVDRIKEEAGSFLEAVQKGAPAVSMVGRAFVELRAAEEVAAAFAEAGQMEPIETPEELRYDALWGRIKSIAAVVVHRLRVVADLEGRLADPTARETAVDAVARQEQDLANAQTALDEEQAYAAVVEEMRNLDDQALHQLLGTGGAIVGDLAEADEALQARRQELAAAWEGIAEVRIRLHGIDTPYAQQEINAAPERAQEIREEIDSIAAREMAAVPVIPRDSSTDAERTQRIVNQVHDSTVIEPSTEGLSPSPEELTALERDQRAARDRVRYYDELERITSLYRAARETYVTAGAALLEPLRRIEELERRRYAAALELDRRLGKNDVARLLLPYDLDRWVSREAVNVATAARRNERASLEKIARSLEQDLKRLDTFLPLGEWARLGDEMTQNKVYLIAQPVTHVEAARTAVKDLAEFERENLEYEARERMQFRAFWQRVLAAIADPNLRGRFEGPLNANYMELVNVDRVASEYRLASDAFAELAQITTTQTEHVERVLVGLRESEVVRLRDYQAARYHAAIAAQPDARLTISSTYQDAFGQALPNPIDDRGWDKFHWANRLLAAEARLWGDRRWIATVEHRLSRLGIETELSRYNSHVAEIDAEIERLSKTAEVVERRADQMASAYLAALRRNGLNTLLNLAFIPVLAMLLVRLLRVFVRRIGARSRAAADEGDSDRQRRFRTLTTVARASITVVVWVVAAMYMLASLGMDITPIVASASVAGLALAFGAQALIRDFFAGFFILLEDQYTIGDVVDVGSASGTVEHISLRVTTLRDLEGVVHYVPNGLVQRVSNQTRGWSRVVIEAQVGYGEDVDRVIEVLKDVLQQLWKSEPFSQRILEEPVVAGVQSIGDSTVGIRLMVKTKPGSQWEIGRELLRRRIKRRFDEEGIRAPYPRRLVEQVPSPSSFESAGTGGG